VLDRHRDPGRSGLPPAAPQPFAGFKRLYRWLNLSLVHHAVWPLLVLVAGAPATAPETTPDRWYLARIGGPLLAVALALSYLAQRPTTAVGGTQADRPTPPPGRSALRTQARVALLVLPPMLAAARLLGGPSLPAAKLLLFGAADVAAFQVVHFGVVARSFPAAADGQAAAVGLFGASWALRATLLAALDAGIGADLGFAAAGGLAIGLVVGGLSRALRRWPGGAWPAAATHWLLVYAVFGFT